MGQSLLPRHRALKKRCVNVAMKLISMSRPMTASKAASAVTGSSSWKLAREEATSVERGQAEHQRPRSK